MSEIYYVLAGDGSVTIGSETAPIHRGTAGGDPVLRQLGQWTPEFMIFGIASDMAAKQALMETQRRLR
jgi:hypothetical protein